MADPERLQLGDLPRVTHVLGQKLSQLHEVQERHHRGVLQFTARLFDEAQPAGPRTYIQASQLIEVAAENFQAVFALIQGHGGATPWAPYNLIRPAMEAAFYALWLIDPDDGRQRRIRGLRLAVEDNRQRGNWLDELVKIPDLSEEERSGMRAPVSRATATYHREADAIGIPWTTATQRIDLTRELGQLQQVRQSEPTIRHSVVAAWRQLSGFQHGHAYAAVAGSDNKVDATITGGVVAVLTVNDQQFGLAMQIGALLQLWAIDTYIGRATRPQMLPPPTASGRR